MAEEVGDTTEVLDEYNLVDLSEGVMRALSQIPPAPFTQAELDNLHAKINKLSDVIRAVDEDHQQASKLLMAKIKALPRHTEPPGGGSSGHGMGALTLGMSILDDYGEVVGTLGQLMEGFKALTSKNTRLRDRFESLSVDVAA